MIQRQEPDISIVNISESQMGWFYIINTDTKTLQLGNDGTPYPFNDRFLAKALCNDTQSIVYIEDITFVHWENNNYTEPADWIKQVPRYDTVDPATKDLNDLN